MPAPRSAAAPRGPVRSGAPMTPPTAAPRLEHPPGRRHAACGDRRGADAQHDADVLVISEYRGGDRGERLRAALAATRLCAMSTAPTPPPAATAC